MGSLGHQGQNSWEMGKVSLLIRLRMDCLVDCADLEDRESRAEPNSSSNEDRMMCLGALEKEAILSEHHPPLTTRCAAVFEKYVCFYLNKINSNLLDVYMALLSTKWEVG